MTGHPGGTITALVAQKRNKSRVNVFVDGQYAFSLAAIEAVRLRKGQRLSTADVRRLEHLDAVAAAYERALRLLAYRPRSEWEIRRRLMKNAGRGLSPEVLDEVVARLKRAGLLDDAEFARYWVSNRQQFKPRSKRALRHELRGKGVSEPDIESALASYGDEEEVALRAARPHAARLSGLDRPTFIRRLGGFLARRGFDYDVSRRVIDQLWKSVGSSTEDDPGDA